MAIWISRQVKNCKSLILFQDGKIPLFLATEIDNNSMCRELLTALGKEQLKMKTADGDTAMHIATRRKNGELLRLLLNSGGNVDAQNVSNIIFSS